MADRLQQHPLHIRVRAVQAIIWWQVLMQPIIYQIPSLQRDQETRLKSPQRMYHVLNRAKRSLNPPKIMLRNQRYCRYYQILRTKVKKSKWWLLAKARTRTFFPIKSSSALKSSKSKIWIIIWSVYCAWRSTIWRTRDRMWWTDAGTPTADSVSRDILTRLSSECSTSALAVARYRHTARKRPTFQLLIFL